MGKKRKSFALLTISEGGGGVLELRTDGIGAALEVAKSAADIIAAAIQQEAVETRLPWEMYEKTLAEYLEAAVTEQGNFCQSAEVLQWAINNQATVAEMRAWGRAIRGRDLFDDKPSEG